MWTDMCVKLVHVVEGRVVDVSLVCENVPYVNCSWFSHMYRCTKIVNCSL